jgi:hypothetical protein
MRQHSQHGASDLQTNKSFLGSLPKVTSTHSETLQAILIRRMTRVKMDNQDCYLSNKRRPNSLETSWVNLRGEYPVILLNSFVK